MLGGLDESSSVILWSLFAPLGAVAFDRPGRAWPWFAAFVATILLARSPAFGRTALTCRRLRPDLRRPQHRRRVVRRDDVARDLARGRDTAQARVETLLLNVLPADIAQRLQSDPNAIADHFDDASILFADVVDFTRSRAGSTRARWSGFSIGSSRASTRSSTATTSRRSRRSATATWSLRVSPGSGRITHTRWRGSRSKWVRQARTASPKAPSTTCASASASARGRSWPA